MCNSSISSPREANQPQEVEVQQSTGDTLPPISTFSKKNQSGDQFAQVAAEKGTSKATPVNNAAYKVS